MRAICQIKNCDYKGLTGKVCEEFEGIFYNVCWSCGDKIKEKLQPNQLQGFLDVMRTIEKELE